MRYKSFKQHLEHVVKISSSFFVIYITMYKNCRKYKLCYAFLPSNSSQRSRQRSRDHARRPTIINNATACLHTKMDARFFNIVASGACQFLLATKAFGRARLCAATQDARRLRHVSKRRFASPVLNPIRRFGYTMVVGFLRWQVK